MRDLLGEEGGGQHPRPAVLCAKGDSFLQLPGDHGIPFLGGAPLPLAGAALGYDSMPWSSELDYCNLEQVP